MGTPERRGGLKLDPAVTAWQAQAAENPGTVSAKRRRDRKRVRIYADVSEEVKAALQQIAGWEHGEDTSVSQTINVLLTYAARAYARGDAQVRGAFGDKEHARTPRFTFNVNPPEIWVEELARFSANGKDGGKDDGRV